MAEKSPIISGASINQTLVKPVSRSMRLDKELNQMLKRLLTSLQDYETTLGPLVDQSKIIKGQIKSSLAPGQKLTNRELKRLIGEKLTSMGADATLDYSAGNYQDLGRAISSLLATNPGAWGDIIEESLIAAEGGDLFEAAKKLSRYQSSLVQQVPFMVGHHEQGLRGYRAVLEHLENLPDANLRQKVLNILETKYGANFGEEGLRYLFPFAHKGSDIGPLGSTKPSPRGGVRKDIRALFDEAFPDVGGFHNLDQVNPNLRKLIQPLIAHSTAARGTKGFIPDIEKIKGLTDPDEIAEALRYYVDANRASYTNAKALHDVIWEHGVKEITLPDGSIQTVLRKEAWETGSVLEKVIKKIPITSVAPESGWGGSRLITKANKVITGVSDKAKEVFTSPTADPTRGYDPNLLNFSADGVATLDNSLLSNVNRANAQMVDQVNNVATKVFGNLDNVPFKYRAWLLNQGPGRLVKGFLGDLGFGTAVGTLLDKEQQERWKNKEYSDFANKAIQDELIGQGVWNLGLKPLWSVMSPAVKVFAGQAAAPIAVGALAGHWMNKNVAPSTFISGRGEGRAVDVAAQEERDRIKKRKELVNDYITKPFTSGKSLNVAETIPHTTRTNEPGILATQLKNRFIKPEEEEEDETWSNIPSESLVAPY